MLATKHTSVKPPAYASVHVNLKPLILGVFRCWRPNGRELSLSTLAFAPVHINLSPTT